MKKTIAVFSFLFIFMAVVFFNYTYANSKFSLQNKSGLSNAMENLQSQTPLVGKIAETMNSGGYTYILLKTRTKEIWVAISETKVKAGQDIVLMPGMELEDFNSKSLNRTFEKIIFSDGQISQEEKDISEQIKTLKEKIDSQRTTAGSNGAKPPSSKNLKVDKATRKNGYTVAELFEKRQELDNKDIVVKGKVVKVSEQIMGKNWLHIQDGTGDAKKGTNDIVVTTQDLPTVGDTVTIMGILTSNKDFGSGYKYDAIIEQAHIAK